MKEEAIPLIFALKYSKHNVISRWEKCLQHTEEDLSLDAQHMWKSQEYWWMSVTSTCTGIEVSDRMVFTAHWKPRLTEKHNVQWETQAKERPSIRKYHGEEIEESILTSTSVLDKCFHEWKHPHLHTCNITHNKQTFF